MRLEAFSTCVPQTMPHEDTEAATKHLPSAVKDSIVIQESDLISVDESPTCTSRYCRYRAIAS
jgi:hypothetical protein